MARSHELNRTLVTNYELRITDYRLRIFDLGSWNLDFGFWILDFRLAISVLLLLLSFLMPARRRMRLAATSAGALTPIGKE
jgi:hypothetical protein